MSYQLWVNTPPSRHDRDLSKYLPENSLAHITDQVDYCQSDGSGDDDGAFPILNTNSFILFLNRNSVWGNVFFLFFFPSFLDGTNQRGRMVQIDWVQIASVSVDQSRTLQYDDRRWRNDALEWFRSTGHGTRRAHSCPYGPCTTAHNHSIQPSMRAIVISAQKI